MLASLDVDPRLLCCAIECDFRVDVLFEERVLVKEISSLENDDDQCSDLCAHVELIVRSRWCEFCGTMS